MNLPTLTKLLRHIFNPATTLIVSAVFLLATLSLSMSTQNVQNQGDWYSASLIVNIIGIIVLLGFLIASFVRLVRQYRKRVLGARLMVRFVILFIVLTIVPISVVYYFSAQFLSRGVDSWFDDKIEQALDDALLLGQGFLEASKQDLMTKAKSDSQRLAGVFSDTQVVRVLEQIRQERAYTELDIFAQTGRAIASSSSTAVSLFPDSPAKTDLQKAAKGDIIVKLEPMTNGALQYRLLQPIAETSFNLQSRIIQIIEPLPLRYSRLGNSLEQASSEYNRLNYLRKPLKLSFLLTLSLITLMATLVSISLALYAARRLVAPINDLAVGTRAVAAGDYSTQLSVKSEDELGLLVGSFNSMIRKVRYAQDDAHAIHIKEQNHRAYLQSVLSNLSSGVLSFDHSHHLQTHNARASKILGVDLEQLTGQRILGLSRKKSALKQFCNLLNDVMKKGIGGEQEVSVQSSRGKQILLVRTSTLPHSDQFTHGWVVVFDDVSNLVHAQRDAAWGEVARRLAHEIKNPLTPIGLSAERIRRKYLNTLPEDQREALDRSTRTISEQVQTLKRMVDAFSNYARSERLNLARVDLNQLVEDVVELHRQIDNKIEFSLTLDVELELMMIDQDGVRQILNNLVTNACEALLGQDHARIEMSTERAIQHKLKGVNLIVKDNGAGFGQHIIDKVFEPYVTTKEEGTGLGMAIVKRIAQAHGGFVAIANHENGGEVKVWLPINIKKH